MRSFSDAVRRRALEILVVGTPKVSIYLVPEVAGGFVDTLEIDASE